jgi:GNAT superfamily N-acetyltransferase
VELTIESGGHWPDDVARILADLPEWFGIAEAVTGYVEAARTLPNVVARPAGGGDIVGVCLLRQHNPRSVEIELLAVPRAMHGRGIGRRLVERVVTDLRSLGVRLLEVKTFGPSGDSEEYVRTRAFYEALGFVPLEERLDIWDADNPCLISVLPI